MPDFRKLDDAFRLVPWLDQVHADFVAERYGALLQEPNAAQKYVDGYMAAEKRDDESYESQRQLLREMGTAKDMPAQELPDRKKIDWDPRKRFAIKTVVPKVHSKPKTKKVLPA